jgi:hypothetical protein
MSDELINKKTKEKVSDFIEININLLLTLIIAQFAIFIICAVMFNFWIVLLIYLIFLKMCGLVMKHMYFELKIEIENDLNTTEK